MTRSQIQPLLVSRNGAMRLLGVSPFTLWKWNMTGVLKPLTVGGQPAVYFLPELEKLKSTNKLDRVRRNLSDALQRDAQLALSTLSVANLTLSQMVVRGGARSRGGRLKALEGGNGGGGVSFNNNR